MNSDREKEAKGPEEKDFWDKLKAVGPLLVALAVGFVGSWFNWQQSSLEREAHRGEVFTGLVAQREKADSDLRAATFATLFKAYFGENVTPTGNTPSPWDSGEELDPENVRRQIMFLHLLALNFETIDIKPLFEDLDARLTRFFGENQRLEEVRREAFRLRENLRKVGRNLGAREVRALASLEETKSQGLVVESCGEGPQLILASGENEKLKSKVIEIMSMKDGRVRIALEAEGGSLNVGEPLKFTASFFDMPYIDNSRLSSDVRLAVVLEKYVSPNKYGEFIDELEDDQREDYQKLIKDEKGQCDQAVLRLIQFPENYMGLRDRPYVEDIIQHILNLEGP